MKKLLLFAAAALSASGAFAAEKVLAETDFTTAGGYYFWKSDATNAELKDGALVVTNEAATANFWDIQYIVADNFSLTADTEYTVDVKIKGFTGNLHYNLGTWSANTSGGVDVAEAADWQNVVFKAVAAADASGDAHLLLQSGDFVGTYSIASVKITYNEEGGETPVDPVEPGEKGWVSIINGGVAADGTTSSILAGWNGEAQVVANPAGDGVVYECPIAADPSNEWDSQLFITFNEALQAGTKIKVSFDYYCSDDRTIGTQAQGEPGDYHYWQCVGTLSAGPKWQHHTAEVDVTAEFAGSNGFKTIAFNLASAPAAASFYINNVVVDKETDVESAVESIETVKVPAGVYNLNGVKVADELNTNLPKGIYIVNGKKVVR